MWAYIVAAIFLIPAALLFWMAAPTPGGVNANVILDIPAIPLAVIGVVILLVHWL